MTDKSVLEDLSLKIGDEISLLELDDRVEKYINDEDIQTPLEDYCADEIIERKKYIFFISDDYDSFFQIDFEVIQNTHDEDTIIKIIE
ncbi:MAG: hypothetical protein ACRC1T_12140 [Clostridium chrysemydis]|uniref:hypothetical protein n=1 Tax=Clostridium chrysemydis TaxID=2665504 RepID=UPI003F3FA7CA